MVAAVEGGVVAVVAEGRRWYGGNIAAGRVWIYVGGRAAELSLSQLNNAFRRGFTLSDYL
jgi:hypothetical protein